MHIKSRGRLSCLYRSRWIPKGERGNSHGYTVQKFIGSLPVDACAIPAALLEKLSDAERDYVEDKVCTPARATAEQARLAAERREVDPSWRLTEARRLIGEAAQRSHRQRVSSDAVRHIESSLAEVCTFGAQEPPAQAKPSNPMLEALAALRAAAAAVRDGALGTAPSTGARTTRTYLTWSEIVAEVEGTADGSLLLALQSRGFVKRRKG